MNNMTYQNNLKAVRLARGYTQRQVAALMKLQCEARISQWENGSATPSIFNLFQLCRIYRVSGEELFAPAEDF